jgi:hypothetical protein
MRRPSNDEPDPQPPDGASAALPKIPKRQLFRLLRERLPTAPAHTTAVAPVEEIERLAAARHDEVFAPTTARYKALAEMVRGFLEDAKRVRARLVGERKRLKTHTLEDGEPKPWGATLLLGVVFLACLSGVALYVDVNMLAQMLVRDGVVADIQEGWTFSLVPILIAGVLKILHGHLDGERQQARYVITLIIVAVTAGLAWGWSFTGVYGSSFGEEPTLVIDMPFDFDLDGTEEEAVAPQAGNQGLWMLRAGLVSGVCAAAVLWLAIAAIARGRAPVLRRLHPDYLANAFLLNVIDKRIGIGVELAAEFDGRVKSIASARTTYVGDAVQAYRARMGGGPPPASPTGRDVWPDAPQPNLFERGSSNGVSP